jgi:ATP-dependent DNA helicase PIF1
MYDIHEDPSYATILRLISEKRNMLITGPGGTGKSTLIKKLSDGLENLSVTALTGCAALLLNCRAKTLHSWAGIGLGKDTLVKNIDTIKKKPHLKKRWTGCRTLIIDEVSMLTPELFERLDEIGRAIRKEPNRPFGGLQLILVGDFCQLPPISKDLSGNETETSFVFESALWSKTVTTVVLLNKIWRQKDPVYQKILGEVRMGQLSAESERILRTRMNTNWQDELIRPTLLFSRNNDVDRVNEKNLNAIEDDSKIFVAATVFDKSRWIAEGSGLPVPDMDSEVVEFAIRKLKQDAPCVDRLELRKGAQVMLLTNSDIEAGLVNGSRGIVVDFEIGSRYPIVKFKHGPPRTIEPCVWWSHEMPHVGEEQIPLRVAYAITIHKSQGASIDSAIVDIGKSTFEYGQAYVALSRVRSLEGLHIYALDVRRIRTHPRVLKFYESLRPVTAPVQEIVTASVAAPAHTPVQTVTESNAWSLNNVHPSWRPLLNTYLTSDSGIELEKFVSDARSSGVVYPEPINVFAALSLGLDDVKVVILGQDPYHGPGQAMGLSFAVSDGTAKPPSLKNIEKEVASDTGMSGPVSLAYWFKQGVLLLNTILTVDAGKPLSHSGKGWEKFTDAVLSEISSKRSGVVFMLWGKQAQKKRSLLIGDHHILEAAHPSPLSAYNGFFGSKHFSQANAILGEKSIVWA